MNSFVQADIFFFIASVGFVIFIILFSIALIFLIQILHDVRNATRVVKDNIEGASENLEALRKKIARSSLFNFIFTPHKKKK